MTMTLISTVTVGAGGTTAIDFNSLASTFTDLMLVFSIRNTDGSDSGQFYLTFNNDSADSSYSRRILIGFGSGSAVSYGGTQRSDLSVTGATASSNTFGSGSIYIPNYSGSRTKTFSVDAVTENNSSSARITMGGGSWNFTNPITSVGFRNGGTAVQNSTVSLYGITKGSGGATVS